MANRSSSGLPGDTNGSDATGPVSSSTITIGGEAFTVDPRGGSLNYSFTFFNGNVNYGQTPLNLALQYQQNAAGSYVGAFTDSDTHAHPYGVSAYLPTPEPKAKEDGGSQLNDSGGVWDLNLPVLFISTSKISKFYGANLIAATLSLGDTSYQILMEMPNTNQEEYISAYTNGFIVAAQQSGPLYSVDGRFLSFCQGPQPGEVVVQDKYGTNFLFSATVLYGYKGINIYDPTYNSSNNADADQLLVYRISNIFYANGQTLNFSYTDPSWTGGQLHTVAVSDTIGNTIATLAWDGCTGTVCIANQAGTPVPTHQLTLSPGDLRLVTLEDLTTGRSIGYQYVVNQAVPYGWQNQTVLANIKNDYTGYQTNIAYQQFNSNRAYSAGCVQFSLAEIAVKSVTNIDNLGVMISQASYDFGFTSTDPNFVMPQASGKKTYASGLNHWLDNIFYDNKDSSGCSSSDRVEAVNQEYTTTISTNYQDSMRNRVQIKRYDSFGRQIEDSISNPAGLLTATAYRYQLTPTELQVLSSFSNLPYSYGSPIATFSSINTSTLNGVIINEQSPMPLTYTQQYTYNEAGNPTQEISPLGQVTEYTYLSAALTSPNNERLVTSVKTHSIGNNGESYVLETQTFAAFKIAPSDGGLFLAEATLPISNAETHYDAANNSTYSYRTDTMSGYIGGNNYSGGIDVGLNGILTKRGQADNTGASDISTLSNQTTASFTTLVGLKQPVLNVSSSISGTTKNGDITSMDRGNGLIHFMGYPLQQTNIFDQTSLQTYDDLGRLTSVTTMVGTEWDQTTSYSYDSQDDLKLCDNAFFSRRTVDTYGNSHVKLFDARQRHIASFQTLSGSQTVQTNAYTYDDANNLISATEFGAGYERITSHYYSPGTQLRIVSNSSDGLAEGQILDALNGINCHFKYAPASNSSPTTIGQIYGPVHISQTDNTTQLRLADGLLDADAANAALSGLDLIHIPWTTSLIELQGNAWASSGLVAQPLLAFYQVIAQLPQNNPSAESPCQLMEVNTYTYDEWNRQVSTTCHTFLNHGSGLAATPTLSTTVNSICFHTAQRAVTRCYPQGQQKYATYNLLNGLQNATLTVAGLVTDLGSFTHDGLGRILAYNDSINGARSTATYTDTGLLSSRVDAYGNTTNYLYDPVSFKLSHTSLFPAAGGAPIFVNLEYDNHLNVIGVQDGQGNTRQWAYSASGQLASQAIGLGAINPTCPLTTSFSYDNFGDLVHVADPWLPYPQTSGSSCTMVQCNASIHGYNIKRDAYGRICQLLAGSFHGVNRNFSYHPVTGLLIQDTLANLPATFGCGDTGTLSLGTNYTYDTNLRTISKTVIRSDSDGPNAAAQFSQTFDTSNRVATRRRSDSRGYVLSECFSYDLQTGFLAGYANDRGSAAPFSALSTLGAISSATYSYDLYGNLTSLNLTGSGESLPSGLSRTYSYTPSTSSNPNPFRLLSIQETVQQDGATSQTIGTFTYDQAGNTVTDGLGRTFSYDAHGLLASIQRADQKSEAFVRDGLGRIVQRNAEWLAGTVHDFGKAHFNDANQLWQARCFAGTVCCMGSLNKAKPTDVMPVAEVPAFWTIEDLNRQGVYTLSYGGNSSGLRLLSNTSQLPFGITTNLENPSGGYPGDLDSATAYPDSVMGTALGADVGTGLRMLGDYRAFDPDLGRFLQWDSLSPFGKGGLNGYAYAGNDPVNFWDPSGHYQSAKSKRYGPKPLEAHHHSEGGFWDGFLAGFKHGMKAFYMTPYNYAKSFCLDLAHHHWAGALKMGFDASVEIYIQGQEGMFESMVLQEFIALSPSKIFSGKSPVKVNSGGHGGAYQWGYALGGETGSLTDMAILSAITFVVGAEMSALGDMLEGAADGGAPDAGAAADAEVGGDASGSSRVRISETTTAHADLSPIGGGDSFLDTPMEGEDATGGTTEKAAASKWQRFVQGTRSVARFGAKWTWRNVILPHNPEDPFPWDDNLTAGQTVKAFVTVTKESFSVTRGFVNQLASWGGSPSPGNGDKDKKLSDATSPTTTAGDVQQLDPRHQGTDTSGRDRTPYLPPTPPPPMV